MIWLLLLCLVLLIIVIVLGIKMFVMRKAAKEICMELSEKLKSDTNTLISISTEDKIMCHLADNINVQLRELRTRRQHFQQGNIELKNAITNISHDLRTPLTTICGYLDVMKGMEKSPKIAEYLDIIDERAELMGQLTEELFRYSIILSTDSCGEKETVLINQILEDSIMAYHTVLSEKHIIPLVNITKQKVIRNLNKSSLSRIFSNLINNAVKYSDGDLEITLSDTGEVIFANTAKALSIVQVERLFDRFYTVESARHSTGLGLSIARTLAERMGGSISAEYKDKTLYIRLNFE